MTTDEFDQIAFNVAFHRIQERVEAARLRLLLAEYQISTHEEIKPTIETWNQWAGMILRHHELIKVYNDALKQWSNLYGGEYKILPLQINPAKCPRCHWEYGTKKACVPGRCGDTLTPMVMALFEKQND